MAEWFGSRKLRYLLRESPLLTLSQQIQRYLALFASAMFLVVLNGCMRTVEMGDQALKPYKSMFSFPREEYGFTSLPREGHVSIEGKSKSGGYDAMLHFAGTPSRTIAFRRAGAGYEWFGEQEIFEGPRMYKTPDGTFHERVTITLYKAAVLGEFQGLTIQYDGPDEDLMRPRPNFNLSRQEVAPLMKSWGYWH
jgi:hypothetical protein